MSSTRLTIYESIVTFGERLIDTGSGFLKLETQIPSTADRSDRATGTVRVTRENSNFYAILGVNNRNTTHTSARALYNLIIQIYSSAFLSWYSGSIYLSFWGRSIQSCIPSTGSALAGSGSKIGISAWAIPLPAVIH